MGALAGEPLAYDIGQPFPYSADVEEDVPGHTLYRVRFPSPVAGHFPSNNTVWGHLYVPKGRPRRELPACVLLLPVMAAPNLWIETRFINALLRRRFAVLWLEMPYQFHRVPAPLVPSGQAFLARSARGLAGNFRQSVLDARRGLSFLQRSGLVDASRVGVFGVSLGAMVGAAVLSVDDRPAGGIFLLGGADFPSLVARGSMTRGFIRRFGIDVESLGQAWKGLDPLEYRELNRGKKALLINARWDGVVPRANAEALARAFPDSRQVWVPFGHYTAIVHLLWVPAYVSRRFEALLGRP